MEEFERTYLVKAWPENFSTAPAKEMLDIYLPASAEHAILRIRKSGDKYEITKKEPVHEDDVSHQIETTTPLSKEEYVELSALPGKRIEKTRHYYTDGGVTYETDVFGGALKGLVLADVEFASVEAKDAFTMPPWCLADITQEKFIAGGVLCGRTYADIEEELKSFGYKKLG